MVHIRTFANQLDKQQVYLKTTGITITNESKLQFYTRQMLNSAMFNKRNIIDWGDRIKSQKTWKLATNYFEKLVANEERHTSVVGGTAKKAHFEISAKMDKQCDNNKIGSNA